MAKPTIAQMLKQAKNVGACSKAIDEISKLLRNKKSILKHPNAPYWGYWYALYVIKGRWYEAEKYIKKDLEWACWYACDVIKGRWHEAEEYIKKDPEWAKCYTRYVIKNENERKKFLGG